MEYIGGLIAVLNEYPVMRNLTTGIVLVSLLAVLIAVAGCTAADPSATAKAGESEGSLSATVESALVFGQIHVKMLEGTNEALEYIVSGDPDEKTESLLCLVEAGVMSDGLWAIARANEQPNQQVLIGEYGAVDDVRMTAIVSTLAIFDEYEKSGNVSAADLQAYEDDVDAMKSALDRFMDAYYASLPKDISENATAAVTLQMMREELLESVGESFEYVAQGNAEEKEEFNAGMDRFMAQAEVFNATAGNATFTEQYRAMMDAVAEYQSAADTFFSAYETDGKVSAEAFGTYEAAIDKVKASYNTLMLSVLSTL
jgi:hypothetical protein